MNENDLQKIVDAHSLDAVDMGRDFNFDLDYSNDSVIQVEKLLQILYEEAKFTNVSEKQYSDMAKRFGSYLGITLIKNLGFGKFTIEQSNNALSVEIDGEYIFFPAKVYRRIKNGPEDSVYDLYFSVLNKYKSSQQPPR